MYNDFNAIAEVRYSPQALVGKGSYGSVFLAKDSRTNQNVAMKYLPNLGDDYEISKDVLRELHLLHLLRHKNITSLHSLNMCDNRLYIIMEYCEYNLLMILENMSLKKLLLKTNSDYLFIFYQILRATEFIHSAGVLHRDIKPGNILLDSKLNVKLCDFGLSKFVGTSDEIIPEENATLTEYMVTRWYRAPEVFLNPGRYGKPIDIWSIACTMLELITNCPIFPGNTAADQLRIIVATLGTPTHRDMEFDMIPITKNYLCKLSGDDRLGVSMDIMLIKATKIHPLMMELFTQMLKFNPYHRITAENALKLQLFDDYHNNNEIHSISKSSISWNQYNTCLNNMKACQTCNERLVIIHKEVQYILNEIQGNQIETVTETQTEIDNIHSTNRTSGQHVLSAIRKKISPSNHLSKVFILSESYSQEHDSVTDFNETVIPKMKNYERMNERKEGHEESQKKRQKGCKSASNMTSFFHHMFSVLRSAFTSISKPKKLNTHIRRRHMKRKPRRKQKTTDQYSSQEDEFLFLNKSKPNRKLSFISIPKSVRLTSWYQRFTGNETSDEKHLYSHFLTKKPRNERSDSFVNGVADSGKYSCLYRDLPRPVQSHYVNINNPYRKERK